MPPTAFIDRVDTLTYTERHGAIRSMMRTARVLWPKNEPAVNPGFVRLKQAMAVVPAEMSTLTDLGFSSLVLVERTPKIADNDPRCVDVSLKYEHILDGPNQQFTSLVGQPVLTPIGRIIYGKGRCSITEKTTNFYYPFGDRSLGRQQILTAHTYPNTDTGVVGPFLFPKGFPRTVYQGGDVSIPFPQANIQIQGVTTTKDPWDVADQFIAKINAIPFLRKPPLTWICSEVQFDVLDIAGMTYHFGFEFQYNFDTWDPTVAFNDQRTGRPPADVQKATRGTNFGGGLVLNLAKNPITGNDQPAGVWNVPTLGRVDFQQMFASQFEGTPAPPVI